MSDQQTRDWAKTSIFWECSTERTDSEDKSQNSQIQLTGSLESK